MNYTDHQLIEKYLALKAHVARVTEIFENGLEPELIAQVQALKPDTPELALLIGIIERYFTGTKKYKDGMAIIENEFLKRLDERGADNTKTDVGTAYRSTITNFNVVDQNTLLDFCEDFHSGRALLKVTVLKDAVREYMEDSTTVNGSKLPPGVEQTQFTRINVRRT